MERKKWQNGVIAVCILLIVLSRFLPELDGLNSVGISTIFIFISSMVLLITVDSTWPLLLAIAAYSMLGVHSFSEAVRMSIGHHLFAFVFLNSIMMAVLRDCGVLNRMAVFLISRPFARKNAWRFLIGLYLGEMILGYFMSCTALMILFLGLTEQIFQTLNVKPGSRFASLVLVGELVVCGVSYGASPIGHALTIMGFGIFEDLERISYVQYLIVGTAIAVVVFILYMLLLRFVFKLDVSPIENFDANSLRAGMGKMSKQEKVGLGVFLCVVLVWLLPGVTQDTVPALYSVLNRLGGTFPILMGVLVLCIFCVDKKPMVSLGDRLKSDGGWNTAFTIGLAMLNSSSLTNPEAGITDFLSRHLSPILSSLSPAAFVIILCAACTLIATVSSPTVGLMLTGTVAYTLISSGVITGVSGGALTVLLTMCGALVFATPCSTYGALVYGSGWADRKIQISAGGIMAVLICAITCTLGYFVSTLVI